VSPRFRVVSLFVSLPRVAPLELATPLSLAPRQSAGHNGKSCVVTCVVTLGPYPCRAFSRRVARVNEGQGTAGKLA
jgi:hypothetical protein